LTLLDSSRKKIAFLEDLVQTLHLSGIDCRWGRAEDLGQDPHFRERYDVVLARAVADLPELAEYCLPLCRKGGCFIASKGANVAEEVELASAAINIMGGEVRQVKTYELPGLKEARSLLLIEKTGSTPAKYPRRPGMAHKRPLTAE
jgi:16S rRNA (guanine527-N7)-methyltransferase